MIMILALLLLRTVRNQEERTNVTRCPRTPSTSSTSSCIKIMISNSIAQAKINSEEPKTKRKASANANRIDRDYGSLEIHLFEQQIRKDCLSKRSLQL